MFVNCLLILNFLVYVQCLDEKPSVLIIGTGASGIAAATKLYKNNFTNIKILEAENRIGGRIESVKFGNAYVDLGAEFCECEEDNAAYDIVKQYNLLRRVKSKHLDFTYSNGEKISEDLSKDWIAFLGTFADADQENCENASSLGDCFQKSFNAIFPKKYKNDENKMNLTLEAAHFMKLNLLTLTGAFRLDDVSAKSNFKPCESGHLQWNGIGFKTMLDIMLEKYPDPTKKNSLEDKILLNKEVVEIKWQNTSAGKPVVKCSDDSLYSADFVIFTPSVGVLKRNLEHIFIPKLPEEKTKALADIGMDGVMKVFLHFPTAWFEEYNLYGLIWNNEERIKASEEFSEGPVKDGISWVTYLDSLQTPENNPNVISINIQGEMVAELEKQPEEIIKKGCMFVIRKFFGKKYNVTEPDQILRTTWYTNPHFRGPYSYEAKRIHFDRKPHIKLGKPLLNEHGKPTVLFAGEATHPYYFRTVHGAIETGYREAKRIIKLYKS